MKDRMYLEPVPDFSKLKLITKKDYYDLAIEQTRKIRDRTTILNEDIHGRKFEKYNDKYADKKGVPVDAVDLTGKTAGSRMINNMKQTANNTSSIIYFSDSKKDEIANKHQEGIGVPKREFFGASNEEEEKLCKVYEEMLSKHIKVWERK